jgi:hypothetical protein
LCLRLSSLRSNKKWVGKGTYLLFTFSGIFERFLKCLLYLAESCACIISLALDKKTLRQGDDMAPRNLDHLPLFRSFRFLSFHSGVVERTIYVFEKSLSENKMFDYFRGHQIVPLGFWEYFDESVRISSVKVSHTPLLFKYLNTVETI